VDLAWCLDHELKSENCFFKRKKTTAFMIRKFVTLIVLLLINILSIAQDTTEAVDMADTMRSNGKIYVVLAVILTIFLGIIIYLVRLDKKMSKLEKEIR
jgi:CcmD family protein